MIVQATLLGAFHVSVDGRSVDAADFERPSGVRLLKLLLATQGHRLHREEVAELLWPEAPVERSGVSLRKAVHFARRALGAAGAPGLIRGGSTWLDLDPGFDIDVDLVRLRDALETVRSPQLAGDRAASIAVLEELAGIGGAQLLPDDPFEEWLVPLRERLHVQRLRALPTAAERARAAARPDLAHRLVDLLLDLEPADESAHRLAIELHLDAGRLDLARRQLLRCAGALAETYGVGPSAELRRLIEADVRRAPGRMAAAPPGALPPGASPIQAGAKADPLAYRSIGTALVNALVEAVSALAGGRPLALAIHDIPVDRADLRALPHLHR